MPLNSVEWEKICERCGRCCYEKYTYRGKIFYTDKPCQYLDTETNCCRIYDQRSELHPDCARLTPQLVKAGIMPEGCPYVKNLDDDSTSK
ncbi:MAG: YkgJ family cysteine cluster protein [Desulfuromusa sp.]|jgi:uncharacterized cysteine cluster protein YcgN (CxxCxxCC family)|nr:YkgJ family cysteine cluster protein [Desulfuromusa sp.]